MESLLAEIVRRCETGERVALCVLVRTRGSTPQSRGAKMLVTADGRTLGTLGGGCVEAEVRTRALRQLNGEPAPPTSCMEFRLDQDYGWDDGLICGGIMDVHVRLVDRTEAKKFDELLQRIRQGLSVDLDLQYETDTGPKRYVETFGPPPALLIVGAGHVGQALAALAGTLDFRVSVLDDRADYVTADRFPSAFERLVGEIEPILRARVIDGAIDANTHIVIVTRGHRNDARALAAVIDSPAKYFGLIGSKRKIKAIFDELAAAGTSTDRIDQIHAPIGLEIGAVTPAEIALSIAAELISVRRGRDGLVAKPMKMDREQMRAWVSREK